MDEAGQHIRAEPARDGQIRRGRKFDQVLAGAREVFLRDGFEGASVDDIAREAGVSKATLYSYFPDKRLLFQEVARAECRRAADEAEAMVDDQAPVAEVFAPKLKEAKLTAVALDPITWAKTGAAHSFPDIPPAEVFGPLVAEYAAKGARP